MNGPFIAEKDRIHLTFFVSLLLLLSGCNTEHPHSGQIHIDHPHVFTRERLINRRLDEQHWLEKQLTSDAPFSIQGSIDTREFVGLAAAVKGNFDPLGGAQTQAAIQNVQNSSRVADLQNQLQVETLKKQIELVQSWTNGNTPAPGTNSPPPTASGSNLLSSVSAVVNMGPFATNVPPVPNPGNRVQSAASLTALQTLDDQLAKRNYIQALLREQELDDTHDLAGKTLYTVKLDISLDPGQNNPSFGQVSIMMAGPATLPLEREFTNAWLTSLNQELLEECMSQQRRYYMGFLTDEDRDKLFALAVSEKAERLKATGQQKNILENKMSPQGDSAGVMNGKRVRALQVSTQGAKDALLAPEERTPVSAAMPSMAAVAPFLNALDRFSASPSRETATDLLALKPPELTRDARDTVEHWLWLDYLAEELNTGLPGTNGAKALVYLASRRYQKGLNGIVEIKTAERGIRVQSNLFFTCSATITSQSIAYQAFTNRLSPMTNSAYVLVVEPKEYAQNLSDVAARERVLSLAASLSALVPQVGASLGFDSSYVRHTQEMFDTIKRQPLLVGFISGLTNFGWVLGPKFDIQGAKVGWAHTAIHYPVEASVVVPGWWRSLTLSASNAWLNAKAAPKWSAGTNTIPVELPGDWSAITRALLVESGESSAPPSILPRWDSDTSRRRIVVQADQNVSVLIRGRDLWRNPSVLIGSQSADQIQVLPDMAGLLAHFSNVQIPASLIPGPQLADLSVVTSAGTSVLRDGVQILPGSKQQVNAFLSLDSTFVTNGGSLSLTVDASQLPKSYGQMVLLVTDPRTGASTLTQVTNYPTGSPWQISNLVSGESRQLQLDVKLGQTPDPKETLVSVLRQAPVGFVYFASQTNTQFQLSTNIVNFSTNAAANSVMLAISIQTTTNLFKQAFPDFEWALANGQASLSLTNTIDKIAANVPLRGSLQNIQVPLSLAKPTGTNLIQTWSLLVTYPSAKPLTTSIGLNTNLVVNWGT